MDPVVPSEEVWLGYDFADFGGWFVPSQEVLRSLKQGLLLMGGPWAAVEPGTSVGFWADLSGQTVLGRPLPGKAKKLCCGTWHQAQPGGSTVFLIVAFSFCLEWRGVNTKSVCPKMESTMVCPVYRQIGKFCVEHDPDKPLDIGVI